jgi:hypothetical protein
MNRDRTRAGGSGWGKHALSAMDDSDGMPAHDCQSAMACGQIVAELEFADDWHVRSREDHRMDYLNHAHTYRRAAFIAA